jgi:hypothetical protein
MSLSGRPQVSGNRSRRFKERFSLYTLDIFYDGKLHHTERRMNAAEVLARIPDLLSEHEGCEKIVVSLERTRLFAVDCKGNRIDD